MYVPCSCLVPAEIRRDQERASEALEIGSCELLCGCQQQNLGPLLGQCLQIPDMYFLSFLKGLSLPPVSKFPHL